MDSVISICNAALRMLKVSVINSMNEGSEQARACAAVYDGARRALLRLVTWNFARTFAPLALSAAWRENPLWRFAYLLPSDCLYAVRVYPAETMAYAAAGASMAYADGRPRDLAESADARFEAGLLKEDIGGISNMAKVIFTDAEGAYLEYVADVSDPKLFDPMFAEVLSYKLASCLAIPLAGNDSAGAYYARLADEALSAARLACANEGRRARAVPAPAGRLSSFSHLGKY